MHFDSIDIALFVNITETGSLTRGANRSYMSVPAASMRIKAIEERLGTQLFYRTNQGLRLAPAGNIFLQHGQQVLRQLSDMEADLREYVKGARGNVRVLANPIAANEFLPISLSRYLAEHRDINIELREHPSADVVRCVMEGNADFGVFAGEIPTHDLQVLPYREDRNVIAVGVEHPLASRKEVLFEETLEYDYISLAEGPTHTFLTQTAHASHKALKLRIQVANFEAMCSMVEMNVGIGLLPLSIARKFTERMKIKLLDLADPWAVRHLRICVRDREALPPVSQQLLNFLINDAA
jgi:DNA-binding transcriptional LysR family regulator